jgi:hypothetical protein
MNWSNIVKFSQFFQVVLLQTHIGFGTSGSKLIFPNPYQDPAKSFESNRIRIHTTREKDLDPDYSVHEKEARKMAHSMAKSLPLYKPTISN